MLDCALVDPQPVAGTDVQYINWVTAANAPLDGQTQPMLIQVDPKYTFYKAERGKPQVNAFDAAAWNAGAITLAEPIVGTVLHGRHRPAAHPLRDGSVKPVFQGTRRIRESARRRVTPWVAGLSTFLPRHTGKVPAGAEGERRCRIACRFHHHSSEIVCVAFPTLPSPV